MLWCGCGESNCNHRDGNTFNGGHAQPPRSADDKRRHECHRPLATATNSRFCSPTTPTKSAASRPRRKLARVGVVHESCGTIALSQDGSLLASGGVVVLTGSLCDYGCKERCANRRVWPSGEAEGATNVAFIRTESIWSVPQPTTNKGSEATTLRPAHRARWSRASCEFVGVDRTGKRLAAVYNDSQIILWSFPECHEITRLAGHRGAVIDLAFAPDGRTLASAGRDHTVRVWDLGRPGAHTILRGHRDGVRSVLFSSDGKELYSSSDDGTVNLAAPAATRPTSSPSCLDPFVAFRRRKLSRPDNVVGRRL